MRFLRSLLMLGVFALPLCSSTMEYTVEIKPQSDNGIYETAVNSVVTFRAQGLGKDAVTSEIVSVGVDRAWWSFDRRMLLKVSSQKDSITLKAIRTGTCELKVSACVDNHSLTESITILVK